MLATLLLSLPMLVPQVARLSDADVAVLVRQALVSDARRQALSADALGRQSNVRPDPDVARDVQFVLRARLAEELTGLSVSCVSGKVTLAGTCADEDTRQRALALADAVAGVRSIADQLATPEAGATPRRDRAAAPRGPADVGPFGFLTHDNLAGAGLHVRVEHGVVRLRGHVNGRAARDHALASARLVTGVRSVVDDLEVRAPDSAEDARLAQLVRRQMEWSSEIDSTPDVAVRDGVATLTGRVGNVAARAEAMRLAMGTSGVFAVRDELSVPDDG